MTTGLFHVAQFIGFLDSGGVEAKAIVSCSAILGFFVGIPGILLRAFVKRQGTLPSDQRQKHLFASVLFGNYGWTVLSTAALFAFSFWLAPGNGARATIGLNFWIYNMGILAALPAIASQSLFKLPAADRQLVQSQEEQEEEKAKNWLVPVLVGGGAMWGVLVIPTFLIANAPPVLVPLLVGVMNISASFPGTIVFSLATHRLEEGRWAFLRSQLKRNDLAWAVWVQYWWSVSASLIQLAVNAALVAAVNGIAYWVMGQGAPHLGSASLTLLFAVVNSFVKLFTGQMQAEARARLQSASKP
jgi:hypothetical protein